MADYKPVKFEGAHDMPEVIVSVASMLWNKTGSWRYLKPLYENKIPPCNQACPFGNDIEGFVRLIELKKYEEAWIRLKEENPFPKVMGRVCFHPCERACNRGKFDEAISIKALERFAGEFANPTKLFRKPKTLSGKKVAIIGSGPAGLSCAYFLARLGHKAIVFEADPEPGGLLRYGIPEYRLPKDVLASEIEDVLRLGVELKCGIKVGKDIEFAKLLREYDALFIGTGAQKSRKLQIPNENHPDVISAISFLKKVNSKERVRVGKNVAVIGGGNSAIDAARVAIRLGADEVTIYYRRSRAEMPVFEEELLDALKEGVRLEELVAPLRVLVTDKGIEGLEMVKMKLGEPDSSGRRTPIKIEGSEFLIICDQVITALGEEQDYSVFPSELLVDGKIVVDWFGRTNNEKVFASGDLCLANRTVVDAGGGGKRAAIAIDLYLRGAVSDFSPVRIGPSGNLSFSHYIGSGVAHASLPSNKVVSFEQLNVDHFFSAKRQPSRELKVDERIKGFKEVALSLSEQEAHYEATRCFHCGVCTECDNCYTFCPDVAITHNANGGDPYVINYDYCKGCGICVYECPRCSMTMIEEVKSL